MRSFFLLLCVISVPALGQSIYKCRDARGNLEYTSTPCVSGKSQIWQRDATPEISPSTEPGDCGIALNRRSRMYQKFGRNLTGSELSNLDNAVNAACGTRITVRSAPAQSFAGSPSTYVPAAPAASQGAVIDKTRTSMFDACQAARNYRDGEYRRRGMNLTFDQRSDLDRQVQAACK